MKIRTLSTTLLLAAALGAEAQVVMNIDAQYRGPKTSPYQYGLFFEEINHAGDGGLYAELVKNRSFETGLDGWSNASTAGVKLELLKEGLLNNAQKQALSITTTSASEYRMRGATNTGYWGMKFEKDSTYTISLWAKGNNDGYTGNVYAVLMKSNGRTEIGKARLEGTIETNKWNKLTATIKATDTDYSGQLQLLTSNNGRLDVDVVSLFPYTWKGRQNGLRPDLAQLLADTKPAFLRFPGGCYVEGEGSWNQTFQWKKTIGPIEQRPGHMNQNWHYWSTDGLGFDEYLQLSEDIGAAPMFVVNVGLGHGYYIPMEKLDTLVQNTLDAIEYANGDASTKFGAMRIANGHAAPYNLKFIEIGNENYNFNMSSNSDQSYEYPERYYMFYKAIKEKYPEIITIGNVEAWGTDNPTWRNEYPVELVDEHYYRTFAWMRDNYHKYDNYSRNIGVYVGEYAANSGSWGKYGNLNAALGEAIFMLGMERNSDVVRMASFAPIFMHEEDPTWNYDMIHFNSGNNFVTPSYHVQKMFGNNLGGQNLLWTETGNRFEGSGIHQVGLATWDTQVSYDDMTVTTADGVVVSDDFTQNKDWIDDGGTWSVINGVKSQTGSGTNNNRGYRSINLTQFTDSNYTLELRARKDGGAEGFLIIFDYQDENNYSWWNIGGWGNTRHAVEICRNGSKSEVVSAGGSVNNGQWYDLKIDVRSDSVKCYMNGQLIHQYVPAYDRSLYQSVQLSEDGKELILKVVNPNSQSQQLVLNATNMTIGSGTVLRLTSAEGTDENTMDEPTTVAAGELETVVDASNLTIPAYSLNIYRFSVSNVAAEVPQPTAKDYPDYVEEDENMAAYLFAHMYETGEHTCYALSQTGQAWTDLFGSAEVFSTAENTVTGGMRDSYICRTHSKKGFLLAGTDMTSSLGWTSNHIMVLMSSPDLVHWTKNVKIDLESEENLQALNVVYPDIDANKMTAAWAPEIIYDRETGKYVLYYSVGFPDRHRIFYQLIDEDLNILTEPRLYFDPGYDIIDADIVWNAVDQQYVMLFKCESTNGFDRATTTKLVPEEGATGTTVWSVTADFHVGENNQAIEGMSMWRPIGDLRWRLAYINYSGGYTYRIRYMDEHCINVDPAGYTISGNLKPQHGSFVKLTQLEYDYLLTWEKVVNLLPAVKAYNNLRQTEQHEAAIKAAEDALNTARATVEENAQAMADALALLQACPTDVRDIAIEEAIKNGKGDLTSLIVNADFSDGAIGWTPQPGFTAANGQVAEYWNTTFRFSQTIEGLPDGRYELSVQSYYRNGYNDPALSSHKNGTEQLNAMLFGNQAEVPVMSIYDESITNYTESPYTYPDNVSAANQAFNTNGLYTNTLAFDLVGGTLVLGIYKTVHVDGDWCCFDNFKLMYKGPSTDIGEVKGADCRSEYYYSLQGVRVDQPGKDLYIKGNKKIIINK